MIDDDLLLERALPLFLRYGIKRTSLEALAAEAGTTRVTVYRRFSDKETLLRHMPEEPALQHAGGTRGSSSQRRLGSCSSE